MESPIKNQINTVFVHVTNLKQSVEWYARLLNQEYDLAEVENPVYNLKINHFTGLVLDTGPDGETKEIIPSKYPLFNFHTNDIEESYKYVQNLGYNVVSKIIHFGDFSYFNVSDPDGNVIMICTG